MKRHKNGNKQYFSKCKMACGFDVLWSSRLKGGVWTIGEARGRLHMTAGMSGGMSIKGTVEITDGCLHVHAHVRNFRAEKEESSGKFFELACELASRTLWILCDPFQKLYSMALESRKMGSCDLCWGGFPRAVGIE